MKAVASITSYADAQVGKLLQKLESTGLEDNTIVVLWGDHGWHLGEHAIWGKHALFEESLRSPLIVRAPGLKPKGASTEAIVETVDLFPTLCELTGVSAPEKLDGRSLVPLLKNAQQSGRPAISYFRSARTIRTDRFRLIAHQNGDVELYDHDSTDGETRNLAEELPDQVEQLIQMLDKRHPKS